MCAKCVYITGKGLCRHLPDDAETTGALRDFKLRNIDMISKKLLYACVEAEQDEGKARTGQNGRAMFLGTWYGPVESIHAFDMTAVEKGALRVNPSLFPNTVLNSVTCQAGIKLSVDGLMFTVYNGLNSGLDAVGLAYCHLNAGMMTEAFAGATDEATPVQQRIYGGPEAHAVSAVLILTGTDEKDGVPPHALARVTGYKTLTVADSTGNGLKEAVRECVESLGRIPAGPVNRMRIAISGINQQISQREVLDSIRYSGEYEEDAADCMAATGIIQIIRSLNVSARNRPGRTHELLLNISDSRVSMLTILI